MSESTNPLLDFLLQIMKRKRLVLSIVFLSVLMTAVFSLVMEKTYQSHALILPPEGGGSPISALIGNLPMGDLLGSASGMGGGSGGDYFLAILNSRVMLEEVLVTFDLRTHYKAQGEKIEDLLRAIRTRIHASIDYESGMISLSVQDRDPQMSYDICQWMIQRLEALNLEYKTRRARESRRFIASEVSKLRVEMDSLEQEMLAFQQREHMLEPVEQARVILKGYGEIKAQEAIKELELRMMLQRYSDRHPMALRVQEELEAIRLQLHDSYEEGDGDFFLAVADLPQTSLIFLQHQRELEIASKKFAFMLPQLEQAKIEEVNETEVLEILDPPRVPEKRIKPKRTIMVLVSGILSLFVASILVLFLDRLEGNPVLARQWKELMSHLGRLVRMKLD